MKKFGKKASLTASGILIGSMIFLTGCKASDGPTATIGSVPDETVTETAAAMQTQTVEPQTKQKPETKPDQETVKETMPETQPPAEEQPKPETRPETEPEPKAAENGAEPAPAAEGSVTDGDYAVIVKGVTIPLHGDMADYTASLGDPDDFASAKSCTEAGDDKVYTYGGTVIYTYITNGADIISLIEITGSETLVSGIHVGSTKEEVIAAYGSAYTEEGAELLYETGDRTIGLQMADNKVSFIELF